MKGCLNRKKELGKKETVEQRPKTGDRRPEKVFPACCGQESQYSVTVSACNDAAIANCQMVKWLNCCMV
jgi:hypothetical protein